MNTHHWIATAVVASSVALFACGDKPADTASSAKPAASTAATAKATASSAATATATAAASSSADVSKRPAPKSEAKGELDKKPAAEPKGELAVIPTTDGQFHMPEGWKKSDFKPGWVLFSAPDSSAGIVATAYATGEDPTGKLGEVAQALQLTDCDWKSPEDVTIGVDEIPAHAADGVCLQGDHAEFLFYATIPGADLNVLIVGGWDSTAPEGTDEKLAETIRSLHKKK